MAGICFLGDLFCEKQTKSMRKILALFILVPCLATVGCASPKSAHSIKAAAIGKGKTAKIRTTAYTAAEPGGSHSASGTRLKAGPVNSAAADWSVYPVGTKFRIVQTGQIFVVDDYGSALVGTQTIDLYKTSGREMRKWGVRQVDVEILEWGSDEKSLEILKQRTRNRHVRQMVENLKGQTTHES
jgi:3D (Asp-Asp-Asp) domain-containing protein